MGRQHTLLISCARAQTVFCCNGLFLLDLSVLVMQRSARGLTDIIPFGVFDTLHSDVFKIEGSEESDLLSIFDGFQQLHAGGDPSLSEQERKKSAMRDRMSITLNVTKSGIVLTSETQCSPQADKSDFDIHGHPRMLPLLSVAANDALVLCTTGPPLLQQTDVGPARSRYSWLRHFVFGDSPSRQRAYLKIDTSSISVNPNNAEDYIELVLANVSGEVGETSTSRWVQLAERLTADQIREHQHGLQTFLCRNNETQRLFFLPLACVLQNGIPWIRRCLSSTYHAFPVGTETIDLYENSGLPNLQTFLTSKYQSDTVNVRGKEDIICNSTQREVYQATVRLILRFTHFVLYRGLPRSRNSGSLKYYCPYIITTAQEKYIALLTPRTVKSHMAIPKVLLPEKFSDLNRMWFLEPIPGDGPSDYALIGRQRLFRPSLLGELHEEKMARVYGPIVEDSGGESKEDLVSEG